MCTLYNTYPIRRVIVLSTQRVELDKDIHRLPVIHVAGTKGKVRASRLGPRVPVQLPKRHRNACLLNASG